MNQHTHTDAPSTTPVETVGQPAVVVQPVEQDTRSFRLGSFVAGFLTAVVLAALGLAVFLVVSDADDDGEIQVEVPAVDVDTGG